MRRFGNVVFVMALSLLVLSAGCARKNKYSRKDVDTGTLESVEDIQLAALRGDDIPLMEDPEGELFIEPIDELVFEDVHFDYDDASIKEADKIVLERISEWLISNPGANLMLEGHCDERGSREYNLSLGERRALGIRRYLISLGIEPDRLFTISYGKEKPLDPRSSEEAWAKNRRGHFLISSE